ncbi:DJ-1 protein [Rhodotorula sp. JG-1b]|nr:DJ-1 protein [Rhodotorula sp. JG-1b]
MSTPKSQSDSPFRRLVRSLSRSSPRSERPPRPQGPDSPPAVPTSNKRYDDIARYAPGAGSPRRESPPSSAALSTSPPPDSYFPPPPSAVLRDNEASGRGRHPDTIGARTRSANDTGEVGSKQAAPGVYFAPSGPETVQRKRSDSEIEGWRPPAPRRTPSQRVRRNPSAGDAAGFMPPPVPTNGTNSVTASNGNGTVTVGDRTVDAGERKGVSLEDKPLTRQASTGLKRTASQWKRAAQKAFEPMPKAEGDKRVMVLAADGGEEIELLTIYDILVRASLAPVIVSVSPQFSPSHSLPHITLSRGARILADAQFETMKQEYKDHYFDAVVVPGGAKGAERLSKDPGVQALLRQYYEQQKLVGCICADDDARFIDHMPQPNLAGSLAAKTAGIGLGGRITSHPSVRADLEKHYEYSEDRVVVAGNLVTSRGPGTAIEWALQIVEILAGKEKREEVASPMML